MTDLVSRLVAQAWKYQKVLAGALLGTLELYNIFVFVIPVCIYFAQVMVISPLVLQF
jgi:hypothetical protein